MSIATGSQGSVHRIPRGPAAPQERRSQLPWAAAVVLLVVALAAYIARLGAPRFAFIWILGVALGIAMQRSRFCFTAAFRDPVLTGSTSLAKAVIVGLAVGTVGFASLQLGAFFKAGHMADALKVASSSLEPVGLHTVVGGIVFGVGAVIAGGCASGTLMRVGEGFLQQWLVLPFFVLGSALAAAAWPAWKVALVHPDAKVWLPAAVGGFVPALLLQFALLFALWLAADWWERRGRAAPQA